MWRTVARPTPVSLELICRVEALEEAEQPVDLSHIEVCAVVANVVGLLTVVGR